MAAFLISIEQNGRAWKWPVLHPGFYREVGHEMGSYVSGWLRRPSGWPSGRALEIGYPAKHRHHVDFDWSRDPDRYWHHVLRLP